MVEPIMAVTQVMAGVTTAGVTTVDTITTADIPTVDIPTGDSITTAGEDGGIRSDSW